MTTTLDTKHRAVIKLFHPGDVLQVEAQGEDVVVLRRMKPAADHYQPRLGRKNGRLVVLGGKPVTNEDVRRLIEDEE